MMSFKNLRLSLIYKNAKQLFTNLSIAVFTFLISVIPAFADPSDQIISSIKSGLGQVYKTLSAIVLPIAAVVLVIAGVRLIISSDQQKAGAEMKHTIVILAVAMAIVYLAPLLITTISSWFSSYSNTSGIFS